MSETDELRVLRSMGPGVGVLDAETDTRIRQRVLDGLRAAGVAAPQAPEARRHEVIDLTEPPVADRAAPVMSDDALVVELRRGATPSPDHRVRLVAAAAIVVLLLGGVLVASRVRGHDASLDTASGDPQVDQLATTMRSQPSLNLDGGKFQHTNTVVGHSNAGTPTDPNAVVYLQQDVETWLPAVGPGLQKVTDSRSRPFNDPTQPLVPVVPSVDVPNAASTTVLFAGFTSAELTQLPADPALLRPRLMTAANAGDRAALVTEALAVIAQPVTPAGVRAAAVLVLKSEGLHAVGDRTDGRGRSGDGFELSDAVSGTTWTLIFDKATGRLFEADTHDPTGLPTSSAAYLDAVPVTATAG